MSTYELSSGLYLIVDPEDLGLASGADWFQMSTGYYAAWGDGPAEPQILILNRLITQAPEKMIVRHINGNKLDHRRENLRVADNRTEFNSHVLGQVGRTMNKNNRSGVRGVLRIPDAGKRPWRAQISVQGRNYHLGLYATEHEAIAARAAAELSLFGQTSR